MNDFNFHMPLHVFFIENYVLSLYTFENYCNFTPEKALQKTLPVKSVRRLQGDGEHLP